MNREQTVALSQPACALAEMIIEHEGRLALDPERLVAWCTKAKTLCGAEASALAAEVLALSIKTRRLAGAFAKTLIEAFDAIAEALMLQAVRPLGATPTLDAAKMLARFSGVPAAPLSAPLQGSEAPKGTFTVGSVTQTMRELPRRPRPKAR